MRSFRHYLYFIITGLHVCTGVGISAQLLPVAHYPSGYFQWPLEIKPALVANFGELRPNHFHMGLDCTTEQKQNLRVLAAAGGYIAKIKIEPFGFGRCIYINHPNGLTTLYAHLNKFSPEIEKYVTAQQYSKKKWKIFLEDIPRGLFPVNKGQFIAYSGSTGGSQGPHLHFEIRDTRSEKVLNPLRFGFPITDDVAPEVLKLAVYDRSISVYEQDPKIYSLKKIKGVYITSPPMVISNGNKISFAISAFDRYTGSNNRNGIFEAVLSEDGIPVSGFQLDSIGYDETRYLNAHIDHRLRSKGGPFFQHLSGLPGYPGGIYKTRSGDGVIRVDDGKVHKIEIEVGDANSNRSLVQFEIKSGPPELKKTNAVDRSPGEQKEFHEGSVNVFENPHISFYLPENSLYDSFLFQYHETINKQGDAVYSLHSPDIPLHVYFPVKIQSDIPLALKHKVVMQRSWKTKTDHAKAEPFTAPNGKVWYKASFREFGNFQLMVDTIPPTVSPVGFKEGMNTAKLNRLAFVITDNSEEISDLTALLDGKWLLFSNDKGKTFIYVFDEMCPAGEHELKIIAKDIVGNKTEKTFHFVR